MALDLQSLFGLLCTAVLIGTTQHPPPPHPAFGLTNEGAIGQQRSICEPPAAHTSHLWCHQIVLIRISPSPALGLFALS